MDDSEISSEQSSQGFDLKTLIRNLNHSPPRSIGRYPSFNSNLTGCLRSGNFDRTSEKNDQVEQDQNLGYNEDILYYYGSCTYALAAHVSGEKIKELFAQSSRSTHSEL
jgi:hypothetical protein